MESDTGGGGLWPDPQQSKEQRLPLFLAPTTPETLCFTARTKHTPQDANVGVHRATRAPGGGRKPREGAGPWVCCVWGTFSGRQTVETGGAGEPGRVVSSPLMRAQSVTWGPFAGRPKGCTCLCTVSPSARGPNTEALLSGRVPSLLHEPLRLQRANSFLRVDPMRV